MGLQLTCNQPRKMRVFDSPNWHQILSVTNSHFIATGEGQCASCPRDSGWTQTSSAVQVNLSMWVGTTAVVEVASQCLMSVLQGDVVTLVGKESRSEIGCKRLQSLNPNSNYSLTHCRCGSRVER